MTPGEVLTTVIRPTLAWLGPRYPGPEAEVLMLSIQRQEDAACTRCQAGGPARGLWMFDLAGVQAVRYHPRTAEETNRVAIGLDLPSSSSRTVYSYLQENDRLACAFARLLLLTDPHPLPAIGDEAGAYAVYLRCWNPGRPDRERFATSYAAAVSAARMTRRGMVRPAADG